MVATRSLTLWGVGTSRTVRPHWAMHELGLPYTTKPIGPRTGETKTAEYTKLNPRQKIPLLQDGEFCIGESAAIVAYLSRMYSTPERALIPETPRDHAAWMEWCFYVVAELDSTSLYVMRRHRADALGPIYGVASEVVAKAGEYFREQLRRAAIYLTMLTCAGTLSVPLAAHAEGDAAAGEKIFAHCAPCHSTKPRENKFGPSLAGVFGRKSGTEPGFSYSSAMKAQNLIARLVRQITKILAAASASGEFRLAGDAEQEARRVKAAACALVDPDVVLSCRDRYDASTCEAVSRLIADALLNRSVSPSRASRHAE